MWLHSCSLQPRVTVDGYAAGGRSDQVNITLDSVGVNDQVNGFACSWCCASRLNSVSLFRTNGCPATPIFFQPQYGMLSA
jgi:hypothetical protein